MNITAQPKQFSSEYASLCQDASVVTAYPYRPPYALIVAAASLH